jgi:hypothetical protein
MMLLGLYMAAQDVKLDFVYGLKPVFSSPGPF